MISSSQIARNHNAFSSGLGANPAAYQNTLFGGVTPFGQNFGDSIGHSASTMASSIFDGAVSIGGLSALGNMGLGKLGLGQSSTLGGLSKYLGGNLSLGMHLGPMMAISAALGQMSQGSTQRQQVQNSLNRAFGSRLNMGGRMGGGVRREDARQFTNQLRELSDVPELFSSMGELTSILDKVTDMKILQGSRDAKSFREKFKKMVGALKDMSRDLGTTMEEALPFLQSSVSQGFLDPKMQAMNVRLLQASTTTGIGVGRGTINQLQEYGASSVRNLGGDSRLGASGIRSLTNQLSIAQQQGILSQEEITRATGKVGEEGIREFTRQIFNAQTNFLQNNGTGRFLTAGLAEVDENGTFTGRLDQDKLSAFRSGNITASDLMDQGRRAVSTKEGSISFVNAMERGLGAEAGSQIGAGGLSSAIGAILEDMGVTGEQARRRVVAQLTGLRQDVADSLLKVAKEAQFLHNQELSQIREGVISRMRVANYKENMTLSGQFTKMGIALRGALASPFQRLGTDVSDAFAKAGDDAALRIGRRAGVAKIMTAFREAVNLPFAGSARALGISGPTASDATFNTKLGDDYTMRLAFDDNFSLFGSGRRESKRQVNSRTKRFFNKEGEALSSGDIRRMSSGSRSTYNEGGGVFDFSGNRIAYNDLTSAADGELGTQGLFLDDGSTGLGQSGAPQLFDAGGMPLSFNAVQAAAGLFRPGGVEIYRSNGEKLTVQEAKRALESGNLDGLQTINRTPVSKQKLQMEIDKVGPIQESLQTPSGLNVFRDGKRLTASEVREAIRSGDEDTLETQEGKPIPKDKLEATLSNVAGLFSSGGLEIYKGDSKITLEEAKTALKENNFEGLTTQDGKPVNRNELKREIIKSQGADIEGLFDDVDTTIFSLGQPLSLTQAKRALQMSDLTGLETSEGVALDRKTLKSAIATAQGEEIETLFNEAPSGIFTREGAELSISDARNALQSNNIEGLNVQQDTSRTGKSSIENQLLKAERSTRIRPFTPGSLELMRNGSRLTVEEASVALDSGDIEGITDLDGKPVTMQKLTDEIADAPSISGSEVTPQIFDAQGNRVSQEEIQKAALQKRDTGLQFFNERNERLSVDDIKALDYGAIGNVLAEPGRMALGSGIYDAKGNEVSVLDAVSAVEAMEMEASSSEAGMANLLDTDLVRTSRKVRGEDSSVSGGEFAAHALGSGVGTTARSMGAFKNTGRATLQLGKGLMGKTFARKTLARRGLASTARLGLSGATRVAGGVALRAAGMAARALMGPVGWALLAADVAMLAMDAYEENNEKQKIKAWSATTDLSEEEAVALFENGEYEKIRAINAQNARKLVTGELGPKGGNQNADKISKQAYEYLVASGKAREIIDQGGSQTDILGNLQGALDEADDYFDGSPEYDDMTQDQLKQVYGMLASGKDSMGREDASRADLARDFKKQIVNNLNAGENTIRGTADLAKAQEEIESTFDHKYMEYMDSDELVSETFRIGLKDGSLKEKEALLEIMSNKTLRTAILNTNSSQNSMLRQRYPELKSLTDEQINNIRQDFKNAVGEESVEKLDRFMATQVGKVTGLVEFATRQELQLKMGDVVEAGNTIAAQSFGKTGAGKLLSEALKDGDERKFRDAGRHAVRLLEGLKEGELEKMEDSKAKNYLMDVRKTSDTLKGIASKGATEMRKFLKSSGLDDKAISSLLNEDDEVSKRELREITEKFAGGVIGRNLMTKQGMNESELIAAGGKEGITQEYIEAARQAAQANTAFVRAVYAEAPIGGRISNRAKQLGGKQ